MKKTSFVIIIILFSSLLIIVNGHAKKIADIDEVYKDPFVLVDNEQFYVWDRALRKVVIYSKKNLKKITEFGKRGEGPGEFMTISCAYLSNDNIYVSSFQKLCIFNKEGKFKKEIKGNNNASSFKYFGKNFIGISYPYSKPYDKEGKMIFSLFDKGLKKKKDIFTAIYHKAVWPGQKRENILWIRGCTKAVPYYDKLIIGATYNGLYFAVFDTEGTMLYEIKKEYKKRRVTESEKKRRINESKRRMGERRWNDYKMMYNIVFPNYYPAFDNFIVDNNKIYVFLFPGEKTEEVLILNLEGKLLDKKIIPVMKTTIIDWARFAIRDGKIYYFDENEEGERWELHEVNIDGPMK